MNLYLLQHEYIEGIGDYMKIFRKSVMCANSDNTNHLNITSEFKELFTSDLKQTVVQNIYGEFGDVVATDSTWVTSDSIDIQVIERLTPYKRFEVTVDVHTTLEIAIKLSLSKTPSYLKYAAKLTEFLQQNKLDPSDSATCQVFAAFIPADELTYIESEIVESLETPHNNYYCTGSYAYMSDGSPLWPYVSKFMKYCKTLQRNTSPKSKYFKMISQLRYEYEDLGIDSIEDGTAAGSYIDEIAQKVESQLGLYSDTSTVDGHGDILFYDKQSNDLVFQIDYQDFCSDIINLALNSNSKDEFIKRLKEYYQH